jgi:hypothetical protein
MGGRADPTLGTERTWRVVGDGDRYFFEVPDAEITFELDRPRRERGELVGELTVRTTLRGARTSVGDVLSRGSFNASSPTVRQSRARLLADLARTNGSIDWHRLVEEFSTRVLVAESSGQPAVSLRDVADDGSEDHFDLDGVTVTRRSPSMIFGDAGTGKSQWLLYQLGKLANRNVRVALADWELDALAHKRRLRPMFGESMPHVLHIACTRPLIYEVDRLRRIVLDERLDYIGIDSVAPACHDEPSSAEAATAFFRALRQLGVGSLLVAHTPKAAEIGQERPFGSQFWYALCRSIWFVTAQQSDSDNSRLVVLFSHRKSNLSRLMPAAGFGFDFGDETAIRRCDVAAESSELAARLPLWQRMKAAVQSRPRTLAELATDLGTTVETLDRTVRRKSGLFMRIPGTDGVTRIALVERRAS